MFDKRVFSLKGIRPLLAFSVIFSIIESILLIVFSCYLATIIVQLWSGSPLQDQYANMMVFAFSYILLSLLRSIFDPICNKLASRICSSLREDYVLSIYDHGCHLIDEEGRTAVVAELNAGIENVNDYISHTIPRVIAMIIVPLSIDVALFTQDVISALIVTICFPFIIIFMNLIGHSANDETKKRHEDFKLMSNNFVDSIRGMKEFISFNVLDVFERRVYEMSERYREITMKTLRIATLSSSVLDLFATCALAGVAIMLGFRMVEGSMEFLPAAIVLILVPEFFKPIKAYASDYHQSLAGKNSLDHIEGFIEKARNIGLKRNGSMFGEMRKVGSLDPLLLEDASADFEQVVFKDISFHYKNAKPCLIDVDFAFKRGNWIFIAGESGVGKTTLLNLISGITDPDSGSVMIEFAQDRCVEASTLGFDAWRERVCFITQSAYIYDDTIKNNVSQFKVDASDEEIWQALRAVGLFDLIDRLPEKLDTVVGSNGFDLSGGERRRLTLARAYLDDTRDIWILDEPTASLDPETELEILPVLLDLMQKKTVILSSHRKYWEEMVDEKYILHSGRLEKVIDRKRPPIERTIEALRNDPSPRRESDPFFGAYTLDPISIDDHGQRGNGAHVRSRVPDRSDNACQFGRKRYRNHEDSGSLVWLFRIIGSKLKYLAIALALGVVANLFASSLMATSGYMVSLAATIPLTVLALHTPSLFVRIFGIGKPLVDYAQRLISHDWILKVTSVIRRRVFEDVSILFRGHSNFRINVSELISLIAKDIESMQNLLLRTMFPLIATTITVLIVSILFLSLSFELFLSTSLVFLLVAVILPLAFSRQLDIETERHRCLEEEAYRISTNAVFGLVDWILSNRRDDFYSTIDTTTSKLARSSMRSSLLGNARDFIGSVFICCLFICVIIWSANTFGSIDTGQHSMLVSWLANLHPEGDLPYPRNFIAAFVLFMFPLSELILGYGKNVAEFRSHMGSTSFIRSLDRLSDDHKEVLLSNASSEPQDDVSCYRSSDTAPDDLIVLDRVSYRYSDSDSQALSDIDLRVPEGQKVAIIGKSGSGKSTLARAIAGYLRPTSGKLDIRKIRSTCDTAEEGMKTGFLEQSPYIIDSTIRENLLIGDRNATDDELIEVLRRVKLGHLISDQAKGLDRIIRNNGSNLSGGERERLAMARLLLYDAQLIILDEPFFGLDDDTIEEVMEAIQDVFKDRTLILITHQFNGLDAFDRIIYMDGGTISMDGSYSRLYENEMRFRRLMDLERGSILDL